MLLAYDKTNGKVVYNSGTNSNDPASILFPLSVVATITGRTDLGILRLDDDKDSALVAKTFTNVVTVSAGRLLVGGLLGTETGGSAEPVSPATAEQLMDFINRLQDQQDALTAQQAALQQQSDDLMLMMFGGGAE